MQVRTSMAARLCISAATLTLALSGVAAAAPYEPNDSYAQATGPMVGGQNYEGAIETSNDIDFFYFNTSGQRQLDISLYSINGSGCERPVLRDAEGEFVRSGTWNGDTAHILHTAPSATQYIVEVDGSTSCAYRLRVDPPDAVTTTSPGVVVRIDPADEPDDVQRLLLNGNPVGSLQGSQAQTFSLGQLPSDARITFEAENGAGEWSWDVTVTNHTDRQRTTVLQENQDGGSSSSPRVGIVRRVVFSPTGGILESCGEALAPVTCIPVDNDGDGVPVPQDCDDSNSSVRPGAAEVIDNDRDENCDGVVARRVFVSSTATLRRKGARYSGRIRSGRSDCLAGRRVVLRRTGARRALRTTRSRVDGSYRFSFRRRPRGKLYVSVGGRTLGLTVCRAAVSRNVRG